MYKIHENIYKLKFPYQLQKTINSKFKTVELKGNVFKKNCIEPPEYDCTDNPDLSA